MARCLHAAEHLRVSEALMPDEVDEQQNLEADKLRGPETHSGQVAGIAGMRSADSRIARLRIGGGSVSGVADKA